LKSEGTESSELSVTSGVKGQFVGQHFF